MRVVALARFFLGVQGYASALAAAPSAVRLGETRTAPPPPPEAMPVVRTPAEWHVERRRALLRRDPGIADDLFGVDGRSLPTLVAANAAHAACAVVAGSLVHDGAWLALAPLCYAGSFLSVAQFALLHDLVHGSVVRRHRLNWLRALSAPSFFGYYIYMRHGHLSHHRAMGEHTYADVFTSNRTEFEDGDVMFAQHRQVLDERAPWLRRDPRGWRVDDDHPAACAANMAAYTSTVLIERIVLFAVDKYTALKGFNPFFANKPAAFHRDNANAARVQLAVHAVLVALAGPGTLVYLWATECLWTLPVHPVAAMFYTNHDPTTHDGPGGRRATQPSKSVYAGPWFDALCFNTNYHVEHHDFPEIPSSKLPALRRRAPDFYDTLNYDTNVPETIRSAFQRPRVYAGADDFAETARVQRDGEIEYKVNPLWRLLFDLRI